MKNKFSKKLIALLVCGSLCAVPMINAFAAEETGGGVATSVTSESEQVDSEAEVQEDEQQAQNNEEKSKAPESSEVKEEKKDTAQESGEAAPEENKNSEETAPTEKKASEQENSATKEKATAPINEIQGEVKPIADGDTTEETVLRPITLSGTKKNSSTAQVDFDVTISDPTDLATIKDKDSTANRKYTKLEVKLNTTTGTTGAKSDKAVLENYAAKNGAMSYVTSTAGFRAFCYTVSANGTVELGAVPYVTLKLKKFSPGSQTKFFNLIYIDNNNPKEPITLKERISLDEVKNGYTYTGKIPAGDTIVLLPMADLPLAGTGWNFDKDSGTLTVNSSSGLSSTWGTYWKDQVKNLVVKNATISTSSQAGYIAGLKNLETVSFENVKVSAKNVFKTPQKLKKVTFDQVTISSSAIFSGSPFTEQSTMTVKDCSSFDTLMLSGVNNLSSLELDNVAQITSSNTATISNASIKSLTIKSDNITGGNINMNALKNFTAIESMDIDLKGYKLLQGMALDGSGKGSDFELILRNAENTELGYSNIFARLDGNDLYYATGDAAAVNLKEYLYDRMEKLMDGQFELQEKEGKVADPDTTGWTSVQEGSENGDVTKLTKAAKWDDPDVKNVADVEFQFSYATKQGRDILFVVDTTKSMSQVVSGYEDAKFYNMQSKLLDVSKELLKNNRYNNRVGLVAFASKDQQGTADVVSTQFTKDADGIVAAIKDMGVTTTDTTDYSLMSYATALIKARQDKSREVEVIFISDGEPQISLSYEAELEALEYAAVDIYSVVQSSGNVSAAAEKIMKDIATDDSLYYEASNARGFSEKVNQVLEELFTRHTLTDVIDPEFELRDANGDGVVNEADITISGPEGTNPGHVEITTDENGNTVLTWTVTGVPYQLYKMDYQLDLKKKADGTYPTKTLFDTNEGDAVVEAWIPNEDGTELKPDDLTEVNRVQTPQLPRGIDLDIAKELQNYNPSLGEATFIFEISGSMNGIEVYNNVAGISFDGSGTNHAIVKDIPLCDKLEIREIYSGNYTAVGENSRSYDTAALITRSAGADNVLEVPAFVNTYNTPGGGLNPGAGVINNYTKNANGYQVEQQ